MKCWETERNRNSLRQDATCYNLQHCVFKQFTLWYKGSETRRYNSQEDIASTFPGELPSSKQTLCDPDHVSLFTLKFQILRVVVAHLLIPRLVVWSQSAKVWHWTLGECLIESTFMNIVCNQLFQNSWYIDFLWTLVTVICKNVQTYMEVQLQRKYLLWGP